MAPSTVREDLDQLWVEWRSHRGAEVALLRGLAQVNQRLAATQEQLAALSMFCHELEARVKALAATPCPDHRFGDRGICFTCGAPREVTS